MSDPHNRQRYDDIAKSQWFAKAYNGRSLGETLTVVPENEVTMGPFDGPPRGKTCQRCNERPADEWWTGEGGILAANHGYYAAWCMRCIVTEQLRYAREAAATIPDLEKKLADLGGKHVRSSYNFRECYACGNAQDVAVVGDVPPGWIRNEKGVACSETCAINPPTCCGHVEGHAVGEHSDGQPMYGPGRRCGRSDVVLDDGVFWRCPEHVKIARRYKKRKL